MKLVSDLALPFVRDVPFALSEGVLDHTLEATDTSSFSKKISETHKRLFAPSCKTNRSQ